MYPKARDTIARVGIGLALLLIVLGNAITFAPGFETEWFGIAAALAVLGLLSPSWQVRLIAVGLVAACAWLGWSY